MSPKAMTSCREMPSSAAKRSRVRALVSPRWPISTSGAAATECVTASRPATTSRTASKYVSGSAPSSLASSLTTAVPGRRVSVTGASVTSRISMRSVRAQPWSVCTASRVSAANRESGNARRTSSITGSASATSKPLALSTRWVPGSKTTAPLEQITTPASSSCSCRGSSHRLGRPVTNTTWIPASRAAVMASRVRGRKRKSGPRTVPSRSLAISRTGPRPGSCTCSATATTSLRTWA